jgi:hypothetical protein
VRSLYRELLTVARVYDKHPAVKALITCPEVLSVKSTALKEALKERASSPMHQLSTVLRRRFNGELPFVWPSDAESLATFVKVRAGLQGSPG